MNHLGSLGGGTIVCIDCTWRVSCCAVSSGVGSELDNTIRQLSRWRVNSWSEGNCTVRKVSRHCSNHWCWAGMSKQTPSSNRSGRVFSHCADDTESVSILRANIVWGGRQARSHTLIRIPLMELVAPVGSWKYAGCTKEISLKWIKTGIEFK